MQSEPFEGRAVGERPALVAPDPATGFGTGGRTTADRVRSTLRRAGTHLVNTVGDLVGDDIVGRLVRRGVVRLAGAEVPHPHTCWAAPTSAARATSEPVNAA